MNGRRKLLYGLIVLALIAPMIAGCTRTGLTPVPGAENTPTPSPTPTITLAADSYLATAPQQMYSGESAQVSLSLFRGTLQASSNVRLALVKDGKSVYETEKFISGQGAIDMKLPDLTPGDYTLQVLGQGFQDQAPVKVDESLLLFVETDKPIYKPGQVIHIRALTLNSELKPVSKTVTIEVMDAKGIKVYRKDITTDDYGMAGIDMPLSTEPNLGVWKLSAASGSRKTQSDIRVEKYVLPKYEVTVSLPKEWYLATEGIKGEIKAEYSYGKPVAGDIEIKASRYVGRWEQFATFTGKVDGKSDFELPAVQYVAGTPASGGMGNVSLDVTVREKSTGYEEKTTRLLTIAATPLNIKIIPESNIFKPSMGFNFLVTTTTPDNRAVDSAVRLTTTYYSAAYVKIGGRDETVNTRGGKVMVSSQAPQGAIALVISATVDKTQASKSIQAGYSPTGSFISLEQTSAGVPKVGDTVSFKVNATAPVNNLYYEVVSRNKLVFTDFTSQNVISFQTTPAMAGDSKLLVYQLLPNSEVAADYLPFTVEAAYPLTVDASFNTDTGKPGDDVTLTINTGGPAEIGVAAVDKSVFILAENRLNLQQVFDELERLYMKPQAELHDFTIYSPVAVKGARDIMADAGLVVMTNKNVPSGKEFQSPFPKPTPSPAPPIMWRMMGAVPAAAPAPALEGAKNAQDTASSAAGGLAEVQRVRQFFPETWLWQVLFSDASGKASLQTKLPDTITTWMLRTVAISKDKGLGVKETSIKAFMPFFLSVDLPYSAVRGEEFPVKVAVYNYLDTAQQVQVDIEQAGWFDLLGPATQTVNIAARDIGAAEFKIRPRGIGQNGVKITARSAAAADSAIKTIIIEPEGVSQESVLNLALSGGQKKNADTSIPGLAIDGSGRVYLAVTSSYLAQTIDGLDKLLNMPFGCGEQNMILLAPDVYITRYLKESKQMKAEIMAKAEMLMTTGYQRELTYMRKDGSFSAFGENDPSGSLFLTAFVLKTFAQAKEVMFIDDAVLNNARAWIARTQKADGSFESIGFVAHQEMMGGIKGKDALTAYVAVALLEAGERDASAKAVRYLEGRLDTLTDAYTVAVSSYALELAGSTQRQKAYNKLMAMATQDENGIYWKTGGGEPVPLPGPQPMGGAAPAIRAMPPIRPNPSADIEATAYATLALIKHGDRLNSGRSAKWLVSKRNAYGGYGSTQDTVVSLQALVENARGGRADVDLKVSVKTPEGVKNLSLWTDNYDVLQLVELPINQPVEISAEGKGEAVVQLIKRYNLPSVEKSDETFKIDVGYDTTQVQVNDIVKVTANVAFNPPDPIEAGMVVVDISVPTGFSPLTDSLGAAIKADPRMKRYDVAGRKVIFYIENLKAGEKIAFSFNIKAMYPVKAQAVSSAVYSYYKPELKAETLSPAMNVP